MNDTKKDFFKKMVKEKNYICDFVDSENKSNFFECTIYKYEMQEQQSFDVSKLNIPKNKQEVKDWYDLFDDNYFQIVFSKKDYSSAKKYINRSLKIKKKDEKEKNLLILMQWDGFIKT